MHSLSLFGGGFFLVLEFSSSLWFVLNPSDLVPSVTVQKALHRLKGHETESDLGTESFTFWGRRGARCHNTIYFEFLDMHYNVTSVL